MRLGYSPHSYHGSIEPFGSIFSSGKSVLSITDMGWEGLSAVALWGGTDINPNYYNRDAHPRTYHNTISSRDYDEWGIMNYAIERRIPLIGICRGAQYLCIRAGGSLVQHCQGHNNGSHSVTVKTEHGLSTMSCTSAHHQMLYLGDLKEGEDYVMLGWSTNKLSTTYEGESPKDLLNVPIEPEVVYFPKINALAVQGHPEWMAEDSPFNQWFLNEVRKIVKVPEKVAA